MTYQLKVVNGTVSTIEDKKTSGGKYLASARVLDESGKYWICNFWNELAQDFMKRNLKDAKIYVEGGLKEQNTITVKFFEGKGESAKATSSPKGGTVMTEAEKRQFHIDLEKKGRCMAPSRSKAGVKYRQYKIKDCVKVNGKWESKMEYALHILGHKQVMEWLNEFRDDKQVAGISVDLKRYPETLTMMVLSAQRQTGDYVELQEEQDEPQNETREVTCAPRTSGTGDILSGEQGSSFSY